ncbi:hypothetical protein LCGC14_0141130 [marine sediment metagenome]|uniref:Right handed beta helix domain-containing protein n=1 Tax=marine sediment metagenome TaxID=412755 RepID=A0A0F9VGC0_9ZZZZ
MATYYVDGAVGADGNLGTSAGAGNAWATIDKAMNTVAAGDKVWVKDSAAYTESPTIDTAGTNASPIVFEGYAVDTGDGGQVAVTGKIEDTLASVPGHYCFKNFDIDGSNRCVNLSVGFITFRNCVFRDTTGGGVVTTGGNFVFYECEFLDLPGDGFNSVETTGLNVFINCKFYRINGNGIDASASTICFNCVFFSCGTNAVIAGDAANGVLVALNCTVDGDGKDTVSGITRSPANPGSQVAVNNIVYDCITGIDCNHGDRDILVHNLVNACTTAYANSASDQEGGVSSAPDFVNEVAGADYSLNDGSPAIGAGTDAGG